MCYLYIVGTKDLQTKQEKDKMVRKNAEKFLHRAIEFKQECL